MGMRKATSIIYVNRVWKGKMTNFWQKFGVPLEITEMMMTFRFPLAFPDI